MSFLCCHRRTVIGDWVILDPELVFRGDSLFGD